MTLQKNIDSCLLIVCLNLDLLLVLIPVENLPLHLLLCLGLLLRLSNELLHGFVAPRFDKCYGFGLGSSLYLLGIDHLIDHGCLFFPLEEGRVLVALRIIPRVVVWVARTVN